MNLKWSDVIEIDAAWISSILNYDSCVQLIKKKACASFYDEAALKTKDILNAGKMTKMCIAKKYFLYSNAIIKSQWWTEESENQIDV